MTGQFSYNYRLHSRADYLKFFNKSEVFRLSECLIFRIPNTLGHFRLGVTIKNRCSSVERNRIKRCLRESFRQQKDLLGSFDYNVVIPDKKKSHFPYQLKLRDCMYGEFIRKVAQLQSR